MSTAISEIVRFQVDRGLDTTRYDALNEHTNIIEELLESVGYDVPAQKRATLKKKYDSMFSKLIGTGAIELNHQLDRHYQADAYCDVIVFAIGALLKLGYDPEAALSETGKEINSRVGQMVDGKFEKDLSEEAKSNWYKADYTKTKLRK